MYCNGNANGRRKTNEKQGAGGEMARWLAAKKCRSIEKASSKQAYNSHDS